MPEDPWVAIKAELEQIRASEEDKPFRPVLQRLETWVNAKQPSSDAAAGVLHIVKQLHDERQKGGRPQERIEEIAGGFFQPGWEVHGAVNQAARDVIINLFQRVAPEVKLPEAVPRRR